MDSFARWLARHPLVVVAANLIVTAVLAGYALHIRIENSLESMLPAGDPKVAYYNATRALFGSDDVGVIGVRADDVFAPSTIVKIARVTDAFNRVVPQHDILRTSFWHDADVPLQIVHRQAKLPFAVLDWRGRDAQDANFEQCWILDYAWNAPLYNRA